MPMTTKSGKPIKDELPGTIQRSPKEAQETFAKAHDSAVETYGEDRQRAHRTAYSALKHKFESAATTGSRRGTGAVRPAGQEPRRPQRQGQELRRRGRRGQQQEGALRPRRLLDVQGRSKMNKEELAEAIARKQD